MTDNQQDVERARQLRRARTALRTSATGGAEEEVWQRWKTVAGQPTSNYKFIQAGFEWLDLLDDPQVELRTDILAITGWTGVGGATFLIETATSVEGPWFPVLAYTQATQQSVVLSTEPNVLNELQRYLRWSVDAPNNPWAITFKLAVVGASDATGPTDAEEINQAGEIQPWYSVRSTNAYGDGTTDPEAIIQDRVHWLKTDMMRYLSVEVETPMLSAATLVLETAYAEEGPWESIAAYTASYALERINLSWEATTAPTLPALSRFLRWKLQGTPAGSVPWLACFRITGKWS